MRLTNQRKENDRLPQAPNITASTNMLAHPKASTSSIVIVGTPGSVRRRFCKNAAPLQCGFYTPIYNGANLS